MVRPLCVEVLVLFLLLSLVCSSVVGQEALRGALMVWTKPGALPRAAVLQAESISSVVHPQPLHIICGTQECLQTLSAINSVTVSLDSRALTDDVSIYYVMLIFLRDFGGLLIDWSLQISPDVDAADMHSLFTGDWCLSRESFSKEFGGGLFPIMSAPRNAPWIQLAADVFENESWGGVNECPVGGGFKVYEHAAFQPFTDNVCDNALHFFVDADDPRRPIIAAPNISSRERLGSWMDGFLNILPGWQPIPANGNIPIDVVVSTISGKYGYPIRSNCDVYLNQTGFVSVLHPISLLPYGNNVRRLLFANFKEHAPACEISKVVDALTLASGLLDEVEVLYGSQSLMLPCVKPSQVRTSNIALQFPVHIFGAGDDDTAPYRLVVLVGTPRVGKVLAAIVLQYLGILEDKNVLWSMGKIGSRVQHAALVALKSFDGANYIKAFHQLADRLPVELDIDLQHQKPRSSADTFYHTKARVRLVIETSLGSCKGNNGIRFTEKLVNPIRFQQAFLVFGSPFILQLIRAWGFQTFHPFIDESYDSIADDLARARVIGQQIHKILEMDDDDFDDFMANVQPRIDFNFALANSEEFRSVLKKHSMYVLGLNNISVIKTSSIRSLARQEPSLSCDRGERTDGVIEVAEMLVDSNVGSWNSNVWIGCHHKTGTVLVHHIVDALRETICDDQTCNPVFVAHMQLAQISQSTSRRYVHFIRRPVHMVISAYCYHLKNPEVWLALDGSRMRASPVVRQDPSAYEDCVTFLDFVRAGSAEQGVCLQYDMGEMGVEIYMQPYEQIASITIACDKLPLCVNVKFESFMNDFDGAAHQLINLMEPSTVWAREKLYRIVSKENIERHPPTGGKHVSSGCDKTLLEEYVVKCRGDKLKLLTEQFGYDWPYLPDGTNKNGIDTEMQEELLPPEAPLGMQPAPAYFVVGFDSGVGQVALDKLGLTKDVPTGVIPAFTRNYENPLHLSAYTRNFHGTPNKGDWYHTKLAHMDTAMFVSSVFPMTKPVILIRKQVDQLSCVLETVEHVLGVDTLDFIQIIRSQMNTITTCDALYPESLVDWRVRNCYPSATHTKQQEHYTSLLTDARLPNQEIALVAAMMVSLVEQGFHYHYAKQWFDYFGSKVHVMQLEQLVTNPEASRKELEDHLGFTIGSQNMPDVFQHSCQISNPLSETLRNELQAFYETSNMALLDLVSHNSKFALQSSKMRS